WRSIFQASPLRENSSMKTTSAFAPARSASSISFRNSVELDVLVLHCEVVDAALGRRDPGGHLARFDHLLHQRMYERAVGLRRNPGIQILFVFLFRTHLPCRVHRLS